MAFEARRAGVHLARLSLLALVAALFVLGAGGLDAVADRLITAGAARMLDDAEPASQTVRVVALEASDGAAQDAEIRDAIDAAFDGAPITVSRQTSLEVTLQPPSGEPVAVRLIDDVRLADLAEVTAGAWPRTADELALSDRAAQRLDLGVGDEVTIADRELTVVGTWSAADATDPAWQSDPSVASGLSGETFGPAAVVEGTLADLPGTPRTTWAISPASSALTDVPRVMHGITALQALPESVDPQRTQSTRVEGGLGDTMHRQASAVASAQGLLVVPQLSVALLAALVIGTVLGTLTVARGDELDLLRARGSSTRRLALSAAAEAALFAAVGAAAALIALTIAAGIGAVALLSATGAVILSGAAASLLTVRSVIRTRASAGRSDAGMRSLRALILPASVAVGLAALASWQLFTTRAVTRPDGTPDPLATSAPALLLIAGCSLAPVIAVPVAALIERLVRRTRGIAPVLPLRQVARRMGIVAVAILCLALAAGSATLAIAAPAASGAAQQRMHTALLGWDVRMIGADGIQEIADDATAWSEVEAAAEVVHTPLAVGSDTATLVAAPPEVLGIDAASTGAGDGQVPVGVTRSLADRLGAEVGTVFTARIRSVARPVPFEVRGIVDALPGIGTGLGVAADPEGLEAAGVSVAPGELWIRTEAPEEVAERLRAEATHPARILTVPQVSAAPVTSVVPAMLTLGALGAAVLGVFGFLAASSAGARARRDEAIVLRALGLRNARRRLLRLGEVTGVAVYAVGFGAAVGVAVAAVVLPLVLGVSA